MKKIRITFYIINCLLALIVVGLAIKRIKMTKEREQVVAQNPIQYGKVAPFEFTSQENKPFGSKDLQGQYWICNFIFTHCMGPCPMLTTTMSSLEKEFTSPNLKFVSFSVDPKKDTPDVLKTYAKSFSANLARWTFLTGEKTKIYELIRSSFKLAVEEMPVQAKQPGDESDFIHSMHLVLVDDNGNIKGYFNANEPKEIEKLKDELKIL